LRLCGIAPELAIQIPAGRGLARSGEIAAGIAQRIQRKLEVAAKLGVFIQFADEIHESENARRLVAVEAGEDADLDALLLHGGALEKEARQPEPPAFGFPSAERVGA